MAVTEIQPGQKTGLFRVHYQIGSGKPGAVFFSLDLLVDAAHEQVSGFGHLTQATNPPLDMATRVEGDFTYMTIMPNKGHILVTATGYPPVSWPVGGGVGPVILPNLQLRMVLNEDWQSGTANYKYRINESAWISILDVPVEGSRQEPQTEMAPGKTIELTPENVSATYANGKLTIDASGHEDGVQDIKIVPVDINKPSPIFAVEGKHSPAIGYFPYTVKGQFQLPRKPENIYLRTPQGLKEYPVR